MNEIPIQEGVKVTRDLANQAPGLLVAGLIVIFFLVFLDRQAAHNDRVADLRIEQCHDVQRESMKVMTSLNQSLLTQSKAFYDMTATMERHMQLIEAKLDALK